MYKARASEYEEHGVKFGSNGESVSPRDFPDERRLEDGNSIDMTRVHENCYMNFIKKY